MIKRLLPFLLASALIALGGGAHAERADRSKPMNIEADALHHDELRQTSVFTGRVVMTKGSIVLRGERLEVRQDPQGYQSGTVAAAPGQRAFFRQRRDAAPGQPEEFVEGEGETIEDDGRADTVKFIRRAELRRYRGAVLDDEITGAVIVYNNLTDQFSVDGQKSATSAEGGKGKDGRVRAMLAPKETSSPGPAPGTVPALRPSTAIDGGQ